MFLPLAVFSFFDFIQSKMGTYGYPVLFGVLLSCGMGLPLPEDIPLFFAGYFVFLGKMNLALAATCAWCGIIGGDCILYTLGMRLGPQITKVPFIGHHIDETRLDWAHKKFEQYGVWVVAVGRMFAGVRGVVVVTAGTIRFNFVKFIIADGLAAIFSGGLFLFLGYYCGYKMGDPKQLMHKIDHYKTLVTGIVAAVVVVWIGWLWWQNRQKQKRKAALVQTAAHREAASGQGM
jgi:membrane protein DedA with SNARE-associated domain